jgi:hypothetical protein
VKASANGEDTAVSVAIVSPLRTHEERRLAFLGGSQGRSRAALTAAAMLLDELRGATAPAAVPGGPAPAAVPGGRKSRRHHSTKPDSTKPGDGRTEVSP